MAKYVKGLNAGTSTLTATYSGKTASISITVNKAAGILGSAGTLSDQVYTTSTHAFTLTVTGASGNVTFNTSSSYLTVTKDGSSYSTSGWSVTSGGTLTTSGSINVGTYTVTCYVTSAATTNYNATSGYLTWTFNITKADPTCSISIPDYTYGGTKPNYNFSANMGIGSLSVYLNSSNSTSGGTLWGNATSTTFDVGTRYIYAVVGAGTNTNAVTVGPTAFTISKASQSAPTASGNSSTYATSGSISGSASGGGGVGTLYYKADTSGGTSYGTAATSVSRSRTSVGTTTFVAYWSGNDNYNASPNSNQASLVIGKASQSAPTATGATVTYGSTATATTSGGGGQGSIEWSNGSTRTAVGSQTTKARWTGNSNYNASGWSNEVTLTVNQASGSGSVTMSGWTYGGTVTNPTPSSSTNGTSNVSYTWYNSSKTQLSSKPGSTSTAGTYYVRATFAATTNYTAYTTDYVSFTISKASQSAPTAYGDTKSYGSTATATTSGGGGQGSIEWSNGNTRTAVGSQTTKARWTGNTNYNASSWSNEVTLTVNKADQSAPTATGASSTYSSSGSISGSASGGGGQGTLYYKVDTSGGTSYGSATTTAPSRNRNSVGTTTFVAYWGGNSNYNASPNSSQASLVIGKASQSAPTATGSSVTYPSTATASYSGGGGVGTLTWTNGSSRSAIGSQTTKAYWSGNGNYNASGYSNEVTLSVSKYTPTVSLSVTDRAYNGNALYASATVSVPSGGKTMKGTIYYGTTSGSTSYSVSYSGSAVSLSSVSVTNVGSATVYAYFVPDGTCNDVYNSSGNASKTFNVIKADQSAPKATGSSVTYPSTATASASGGGGQGSIEWYNGSSRSSVGSQTTKARWSGNSNYNASGYSNEVTLSVAKYTPTVTLSVTDRKYNGNALYATATVSGASGGATPKGTIYYGTSSGSTSYSVSYSGSAVSLSSVSVTNVGSATVYAYFAPDSTCSGVYNNSGNVSKTFTVSKADQSAPTATGATVTYPSTATATATGGGGQGTLTWTNGDTQSGAGSKTTKAYWAGNSNYNASGYSNEVTLKVNKAAGSTGVSTSAMSITYSTTSATRTVSGNTNTVSVSSSNENIATVSISGSTITVKRIGYGSATITASVAAATNYEAATSSFTVTNYKAAGSVKTVPANNGATYGSGSYLCTTGASDTGTMYYRLGTSGSYSTTRPTTSGLNVGSYTLYYYAAESTNYYATNTASITVTVVQANGSVAGTVTNRTYNTSGQTVGTLTSATGDYYLGFGSSTSSSPSSWGTKNVNTISATTAGTYYVWAKCDASTNYKAVGATYIGTATIDKASQSAPTATGGSNTYSSSGSVSGSATGGGGVGTLYYQSDANGGTSYGTATTAAPSRSRSSVGTTTFIAYWGGNSNYYPSPASKQASLTISRATGYLTGTVTNRTYNGGSQVIGSIESNSGTYYFGLGSSTTSGPSSWGSANTSLSVTNKGTYYVWAKCDQATNYNAVSAKYIGTATVGVRTVTVTAPTRTNRTYNGSNQTIFAAGSCSAGGTMYYSTSDSSFSTSTWSTDFPYTSKTNAGTYTIYYYCYVSDTTNNTGTGINTKGSISATISKASTNAPVLVAGGTTTYNGNTYYATAANGSGNPGGTIYYGASSGASTYSMTAGNATNMTSMGRKDVGTTTIYAFFKPTDTTNYSNSGVVSTTVTITNKAGGSGSVTMSGWTYGGTVTNPTPSSSTNGTSNVSYTWYNSGKTTLSSKPGSTSTAGTYYVKATFAATTNYTAYTTDYVSFTISKAAGSGSVTMSGWTYEGTVTNPTPSSSTNGTSNVSYTWYNSSKTELSSKPGSTSTAGTYYVRATFAATANYNSVTTDYVSFTISKATGTLSGSATDRTYNGSGQTVGTITSTTGTYYLGFGSSTTSGPSSWGSANSSLSATNVGTYYVWAKCDESTNYNCVGSKYIGTATISKKAVTVTAASDSKVYNGTALTNNTASISGQVSGHTLNSVTVTGSQTNVGSSSNVPSGAKIYSGSTDVTSNYSITYTNGTLTVSNATITVSAPNQSYTYTGSAQGNAITATTVNSQTATIKYGTTSGTYNLTSAPQITNVADSKTIYYKVTAPNHADKTGSYTLTITNKAISIPTPTSTSKTYDRTAYSATFGSATGATITKWRYSTDNSTWTETSSGNPTQTNYGTLYVQAYYSANTNYTGSGWSASATISIAKREVTLTWGTHTWTYDGGAKTVTCTAGNVVSGDTCTVNLTGATRTSAGSQTVTASSLSNTNYKLPSTNTTILTINKATLTVVESSYSGTYDGNNHSSTVKVTNSDWTGKTIVYGSSTSYGSTATTTGTYNTAYAVHTAKNYTSSITIYYKITGDDNYNDFADSVTFQISKATGSLTGSASNKTYNASSQVIGTISANTGTYYLGLGSSTTSGPSSWGSANSSLSVKDAGTYYVWAKCDGSTNYNAVSAKYIGTATVSQKSVTVTAGSAEKVYNGTALTSSNATATGLVSENHHLHSWTCTGSQTYVGSGPNTASNAKIYEGTHNGTEVDVTSNYSISYSQGVLSVTKATPVVTVTGVTEDYTGGSFYSTAKANAIGTFYWKKGSAPTTSSYDGSVELSTLNTATNAAFVKNNSDDFEMFWLFVPSGTATIASGQTYSANFSSTSSGSSGVNLIINPRDISKVSASAASVTYNGSQQTASVTVTDTATITSSDYTISGNTGTNAGNYSITITGKNNYTGTKTITWTINKKSVTVTAGSASKVYDGTPLTKTDGVTTTTLGTGDHLHSFKVTGSITNVGIENNVLSEIKIYKGAHNGTETDATSNYTITPENGTLIVNNATITVSAPNQEYTYNGSVQGAAISASAVGGQTATIKYGTTNGSYTLTSAPQITTVAESKTIYYQVTAPNHTTKTGSYLLTIKKFTVNATATNQSKTYNGTALNAENTGSIVETLPTGHTITYSCTGSQTNVGSSAKTLSSVTIKNGSGTDVTANFTVNKNNGTLTVNAATITVSAPKQSYTYDGNKHGNAITVTTVNSQEATIKYSTSSTGTFTTTVPQITNVAESKTIYYQVTAPNHTDKSGSYELEITEKSISIPAPTAKEETYTGTAYSASFGSATGATITKYQYSSDNSTWTDSNTNPTRTDSGTTYVRAYYTAGTNYKGSGWSTSTTIKVNNATMTVSASNQSYMYNGSAQGTAISATTVNSQAATITYGTTSGSYTLSSAPKITNVSESKTIYYKVTAPNHNDKTGSYTLTITQRAITFKADDQSKVYDGTALSAENTATRVTSTGNALVSGHTVAFTCSGTQTVVGSSDKTLSTVTIYDASTNNVSANYAITKNKGALTVTARTVTFTEPTFNSDTLTYNKSSKTLASGATCSAGGVMYYYASTSSTPATFSTTTWSTDSASAVNAGTYNVWYYCYVVDTDNNTGTGINTANKMSGTKTIGQREVTLTWGTRTWTYDGSAHSTTCTAGNLVSGDTCTVTLTGNSITEIGSQTVTASSLSNPNYKLPSNNTATLTIEPGMFVKLSGSWTVVKKIYKKISGHWTEQSFDSLSTDDFYVKR